MRFHSLPFSLSRLLLAIVIICMVFTASHATAASPTIYLQDAREIGSNFSSTNAMSQGLQSGQMRPIALAEGDLDEDGAMELLVGYPTPSGGALAVYRGNINAFAPQSDAALREIGANQFPTPLLPDTQLIQLPLAPDFVAVGQFNPSGHNDVVVAARGGSSLYVLSGNGKGGLTPWSTVSLPGTVSVMATRSLGLGQKSSEVVVGVNAADGPALFVFGADDAGLVQIARIPLSAPATALAFGDLAGDSTPDIAVVAGGMVQIVFGKGIEALANGNPEKINTETVSVVSGVTSLAIGRFLPDRTPRMQMAVLSANGTVLIVGHGAYDARPYTTDEWKAVTAQGRGKAMLPVSVPAGQSTGWQVLETFAALAPVSNGDSQPIILRGRISSQAMDDVMVLSPSSRQLFVIAHMNRAAGETTMPTGVVSSMPLYATPVAVIAARVNISARPGLVLVNQGQTAPSVMMPLPDPTFVVNTTADTVDANPGNGVCADSGGQCSLRAAIMEANALSGEDYITLPAGTYTLTIPGIDEDTALTGDLDITDSLSITGVAGSTIIQAGTNSTNGIDKVFSINPYTASGPGPSINVSLSGLTIRYGRNTSVVSAYGGGMDFDAGTAGTGTLTITNCVIENNSVPDNSPSDGGGLLASNEAGNNTLITITGSTIQNNSSGNMGGAIGTLGGLNVSITGSTIQGNTVSGSGAQQGGAIYHSGGGTFQIHNTTISGNSAGTDGGGFFGWGNITIDQGSIIRNNTAGRDGGGLFLSPGTAVVAEVANVSACTITGNSATRNGGGIEAGSNTGNVNIHFSRIVGNTALGVGSALDRAGTTVNATNNWWGINSPGSLISGTATYDPYIVLSHTASPNPIRINQSTTLTADMSKDNHGNGAALVGNLGQIAGLPVTFGDAIRGTIPNAQPESLNTSAQATATFNAGGSGGRGTANATVDQAIIPVNQVPIVSATETGTAATITTSAAHGFTAGESVVIAGVGIGGYNGTFVITSVPTSTTLTYTTIASLGASSGGTATVGIIILEPPSIGIAFGSATVATNTATTLTFSISNPNIVPINASFTDTLPSGLVVSPTPGVTNNCGGTVTATAGSGSISYSNSSHSAAACLITVNVQSAVDNNYSNSVTINSTDAGNGNTASANLTVINPPIITKSFGAATIPLTGTTTLSFALNNPNTNLDTQGMSFTDSLPAGLVVAATPGLNNTCGGTGTAIAGASSVSVTGFIMRAGTPCSVSVNVQGTIAGVMNNSVYVTSSNAADSNTSNASVTVVGPPTITKSFGAVAIPLNGTTSLSFTVQNNNTANTLHGIGFTDPMPAGLSITSGVTGSCGGGLINLPGSSLTLSGATLAPGASCNFSVTVTGIFAGLQTNTTGNVTSTEGGTGGTATASVKVEAPPAFSDVFNPNTIALNATASMQFTLTNPAANLDPLTGVGFTMTLPTGLTVANASTSQCGGTLTTTAPTGIVLSGATLAVNSQCQFNVTVTGATAGYYEFIGGPATSTNGGSGNQAIAYLTVMAPPAITKAFGATQIPLNGTTSLTFTIQNPNTSATLTGVAFTDSLPAGLVVASTPNLSNTCAGIATAVAGSGSVSLLSGSLAANTSCTVSVTVQGTTAGSKNNTVQVTSTQGGTGNTSNASVGVVGPPSITKTFGVPSIPLNGSTSLTFNISNPNATYALNGVSFSDTLPAGLVVSNPNGLTGSCGAGTITAVSGTNVISLSGGATIPAGSCTFAVNVTGIAAGTQNNTTGNVTSTEGGTGSTASASLNVEAPPSIAKIFNPSTIGLTATTSLTFTITNPAANANALTGVAFIDTLPTGLTVANASATVCGGTLTTTAPTGIALSGATIATNSQCQFNVTVTGAASGIYTNTTGNVTSTNGGTGNTATANLIVASPPIITEAFGATSIAVNGTTTLTFNISNPNTSLALTGLAFTDNLPAGLVVGTPANLTNSCGGTATASAGANTMSLSAGALAASTSCSISVSVQGTTAGVKNNSVQVSSINAGIGNTANASLTIVLTSGCLIDTTQADFLAGVPTNCDLTGSPGDVTLLNGPGIDQQNTTLGTSGVGITVTTWGGQTFTPSITGQLTRADINLFCSGCTGTTPDLTLSLRATSGGLPTGADLASATVTGFSNGSAIFYTATFGTPPTVTAGTQYALVIRPTANPSPGTYALTRSGAATAGSDVYAGGTRVAGASSGTVWSIPLTGGVSTDAGFKVFIDDGITSPGTFVSSLKDATPADGETAKWRTLSWTADTPAGTDIRFQVAASNNPTGPFNFVGPDGTSGTFFSNGDSLLQFLGNRYLKYQALFSTSNTSVPTLHDVTICFNNAAMPPTITKEFSASQIPLDGTASLTFTIGNSDSVVALSGVSFTDNMPAGLVVASTPNLSNTCGGTATAVGGAGSVSLSGGTLLSSATCTVTVDVQGTTAGVKNNSVQVTSTEGGTGNTSNASITVVGPPGITKTFGASSIPLNGSTSLSFTIQNSNTTTALTGVGFSDTFPAGLVISTPNGLTGSCGGGTITATQATNVISLSGASIAAGGSCTFSVNVTGTTAGTQNNTTGAVTSSEGGTGGTASASIDVVAPPSISKSFNPDHIPLAGSSTLGFRIDNPAANAVALTGVAFTDTLPVGLSIPSMTVSYCSGTLTLTAPRTIAFSGGTIAAGGYCSFGVGVSGNTQGVYNNTTGAVTSTNGGTGNTASATLSVASPPTMTTAFGVAQIPLNGTTSLTFTLSNPAANTISLTGVGFTDSLPAGLVVASPSGLTSNCGGTATAVAGASSFALSGATLATNATCQLSVNVTGTTAGVKNNSVLVTSTEGGNSSTSNASITVVGPPTITKVFGAASIQLNASTTLTFTITNPNATAGLTGLAFSDTFPAGLVISTPNGLTGSCGSGTISATAGGSSVSLSGGTIAAAGSCTFAVNVTGNTGGVQNNVTGNVTSTEGGTGGTASASITVLAPDLTIASAHTGNFRQGQTGVTYSLTVSNSGAAPTSGTVTVVDTLPSSLTATAISGTGWTCVLGTLTCTRTDALAISGNYPAITLTVNVANNAPTSVTNTVAVSGGGETDSTNNTASDPTTVVQVADLTVTKSHTGNFVQGFTGTYTLVVNNVGPGPTTGTVTLVDTLPTGLTATAISGTGWSCTLGTLTCTRSDVLNDGSSYPAVTVTVTVAANASSSLTNSATVSGGGELNTSNDSATDATTVQPALALTSTVSSATVKAGDPGQFTLGLTAANGVTGTVSFACASVPTGAECVFQPATVTASTSQQVISLTITTSPKYLAGNQQKTHGKSVVFYAMLSFPMIGVVFMGFAGRRRGNRWLILLVIALGIIALAGCGSRKANPSATPPGSYPITVTATNGTSQAQTVVTLTVR